MASDHQIDRAFQDLGALFAAEHSEHDDQGARQVGRLIRLLRKFKAHEQAENGTAAADTAQVVPAGEPSSKVGPPLAGPFGTSGYREAAYPLADGRAVWYDDGRESVQDAADLYAVVPEKASSGSPNLENLQARHILDRLQTGQGLGETHIATLRALLVKHKSKIDTLRRSSDRGGQDLLTVAPDGPSARIIPATER